MIKASSADYIGVTIKKSNHSDLQADGVTPLNIVGECHFTLSRDGIELQLEALVVNDLDVDILAGIPFMSSNDIAIFPSKHKIVIRDKVTVIYGSPNEELNSSNTRVRRTQAFLIRAPSAIRLTTTIDNAPEAPDNIRDLKTTNYIDTTHTSHFITQVSVDPDNLLSPDLQNQFNELLRKFSEVFSPNFEGYNGAIGPFESSVNMGSVQPPQRKGRMPQYSKNNLVELQNKFDELESKGVFRKPEDVGISVECINPSFLVKKASGGFRLVTAFADVGRYSKPQPSLMPDPLNGPSVVVRVDPAPGFCPLCDDSYLKQLNISIEIGRVKNQNKNPVADKAIAELEDELLREDRDHSPLSENTLGIATTRLNSRFRQRGLSSRELWTQRSQFTHEQLPISDMNLIRAQHEARNKNHGFSEIFKCSRPGRPIPDISIGDLVYLYTDRSKTQSRDRYLVVARDGEWCFTKTFSGNQLRASSYKVKLWECYKVLNTISVHRNPRHSQNVYNEESDCDDHDEDSGLAGPIRDLPPARAEPPPILICKNIDDVENLDEPTGQPDNSLERDLTHSTSSNEQDNKRVLLKRSELKTPARFKDFIAF
ncbi:unnamed protein product [Mytilus coruscus]|uniref:Uncharacterized protein n=1 Tax=Mytilus coruscus TaxID=42192 RepID=A0A6J8DLL0_MYTCO|nr:unnamed protein product [Mytilus coruscus]